LHYTEYPLSDIAHICKYCAESLKMTILHATDAYREGPETVRGCSRVGHWREAGQPIMLVQFAEHLREKCQAGRMVRQGWVVNVRRKPASLTCREPDLSGPERMAGRPCASPTLTSRT
jgi:hypothetical protein